MNKFAKYVPEEDKKKQREHIGAMGGVVVVRCDDNDNFTCNMTHEEYLHHLKNFTLTGGVFLRSRSTYDYRGEPHYAPEQYMFVEFGPQNMRLPEDCVYSSIVFDNDGTVVGELPGEGPM